MAPGMLIRRKQDPCQRPHGSKLKLFEGRSHQVAMSFLQSRRQVGLLSEETVKTW